MSRPSIRRAVRRAAFALTMAMPVAAQEGNTTARIALVDARRSLEAGSFREAESKYAAALRQLSRSENQLRAAALFGRAFAAQQRLVNGDTADLPVVPDSLLNAYREAADLNPKALGAAATDNIAVVLAAIGRKADAANAYLDAGRQSNSPQHYVSAGREFDAADDVTSALRAYRQSLALDSTNAEARRALLELLARARPASEVLEAVRVFSDTASARDVSNALVAVLVRSEPRASLAEATEATIQLARTWPRMRMGTPYFDVAIRDRLTIAAERSDDVRRGLTAMIEAYSQPRNVGFVESTNAQWWHRDDSAPNGRSAAWSSLLRSLGDWYNQQQSLDVARSYYEAAIGLHVRSLNLPSVDRSALLPLALIYAQADDRKGTSDLHTELKEFTEIIFSAKSEAYRAADLVQIREFHTTLGAFYSVRGEWTGEGAQNAKFQLEHMREASRALAQRTSKPVNDPPELLERLAIYYKLNRQPDSATRVRAEVVKQYERLHLPNEATAAKTRIDTTTKLPGRAFESRSRVVPQKKATPKPTAPSSGSTAGASRGARRDHRAAGLVEIILAQARALGSGG